ncbi:MAG: hypothetical protein AAGB05_02730 [Pseudomonadota bacterium]
MDPKAEKKIDAQLKKFAALDKKHPCEKQLKKALTKLKTGARDVATLAKVLKGADA